MRFGTVTFQGAAGEHRDNDGRECEGRIFGVKVVGVGGVYTNVVECSLCERELIAYENGLAPEPVGLYGG